MTQFLSRLFGFLDRWFWVALLLAAPLFVFPSPQRTAAFLLVPLGWIIAWCAGRTPVPRTPLNASLLVMYAMVAVSLFVTWSVPVSLPKIAGMIFGLAVFMIIARTGAPLSRSEDAGPSAGWWTAWFIFLALGLALAGVGLFGTRWLTKLLLLSAITSRFTAQITFLPGAAGGFQPNEVAGSLLWAVPMWLALCVLLLARGDALRQRWGGLRWLAALILTGGATLFVVGVLALTQSRSAYAGIGVAVVVLLLAALPWRGRLALAVVLALVVVSLAALGGQGTIARAWQQLAQNGVISGQAFTMRHWQSRVDVWSAGLQGLRDYPVGMGMNAFRGLSPRLYPSAYRSPTSDVAHAHNEFLQAGLDLGLPGLVAFAALYLGAWWMLRDVWRAARFDPDAWHLDAAEAELSAATRRTLTLGLGGGLLAHGVFGLTDAVALGAKPGVLFWMLLGLIAALHAQTRNGEISPRRHGERRRH